MKPCLDWYEPMEYANRMFSRWLSKPSGRVRRFGPVRFAMVLGLLCLLSLPARAAGPGALFGAGEDGVRTAGQVKPSFLDLIERLKSRRAEIQAERAKQFERESADSKSGQPASERPKTPVAAGADVTPTAPKQQGQPAAPPAGSAEAVPVGVEGVRFNFDDADVFEVIRTVLGDILKVNYLIDPTVSGRVNFRSTTVVPRSEILPLLQVILRLNGIGLVEESGLYRVIPLGNIQREPAQVRFGREADTVPVEGKSLIQVVPLEFREAAEMVGILAPYISQGAQVVEVPKSNYIVIADSDANVRRLLELIDIFDGEDLKSAEPQVFVYHVQNSKAADLASILNNIFLGHGGKSTTKKPASASAKTLLTPKTSKKKPLPRKVQASRAARKGGVAIVGENTRIFADEVSNILIILATPDDYKVIEEAVKKVDIVPRQVLIEALVAEVTLNDDLFFGVEWFIETKFKTGNTSLGGITGFQAPQLSVDGNFLANAFSFAAIDSADAVRGLLQTLATESELSVLASPHVIASDNQEATIKVGKQVPIVTSETSVSGTTDIQRTIQYRDTGIILNVTPQINEGGLVALDISQEVSSVQEGLTEGTSSPTINSQEARTRLVVQDGQTVILGGMIREDNNKSRSGIPILKDIPILGFLFGYWEDSTDRTELIVLITPHVIRNEDEAAAVTETFSERLTKAPSKFEEGRHHDDQNGSAEPPAEE